MYEIVSDMSTRQDALEERLSSLEDKLQGLQVSIVLVTESFIFAGDFNISGGSAVMVKH